MVFTVYKNIKGRTYAYEIKSIWNKEKKKTEKKNKYLGVVIDKDKGTIKNKKIETEKLILDFGDSYLIDQIFKETKITKILSTLLKEYSDTLFSIIHYKLCYNGAMMYTQRWHEGSYSRILYKKAEISSQRISDFFTILGEEKLQREFFKHYFETLSTSKKGIIIDGTSLPNQIQNPLTAWGRSGEEIDKQIRFLLVVDKENSMPLLFRSLPGNIVDVSTVKNTIKELAQYGIKDYFIYHDAGFFSEENINEYYINNIHFLTRLPATRILYKQLIKEEAPYLEKFQNGTRYGKRGLFVKERVINLFGKKAYAYIVQDLKRKARELERYLIENLDERNKNPDQEYDFINNGIMILVSSFQLSKEEVVPAYYIRQTAEMLFGFSKDDLGMLPLRVHNGVRIQGFLFLQFISLIYFIQLKNKLGKDYTVEEALLSMKNLKCKVYDDKILINELTKEQKEITKKLSILVPNSLGI